MALKIGPGNLEVGPVRAAELVEGRKTSPIKLWAALGAFYLVAEVFILGKWMLGPNFKRIEPGPTPVPSYMKVSLTVLTIVSLVIFAAVVWFFLIKPWRREGHITLDGLLTIAFTLLFWQDPLSNMWGMYFSYNSWLWNRGSWICELPGVLQHNACSMPEVPLIVPPMYCWVVFGGAVAANVAMRWIKRRFPRLGAVGLIAWTFALLFVADMLLELSFVWVGFYTFFFGIPGQAWFHGSYLRFPVQESIFWGLVWTAFASFRYFTNDRGQTIAERGAQDIEGSRGKVTGLRFLAVFGAINLMMTVLYNLPLNILDHYSGDLNHDQMKRSYFMNHLCGDATDYACPGPGTPVWGPDTMHVDPHGTLHPGTAPLPPPVNFEGGG